MGRGARGERGDIVAAGEGQTWVEDEEVTRPLDCSYFPSFLGPALLRPRPLDSLHKSPLLYSLPSHPAVPLIPLKMEVDLDPSTYLAQAMTNPHLPQELKPFYEAFERFYNHRYVRSSQRWGGVRKRMGWRRVVWCRREEGCSTHRAVERELMILSRVRSFGRWESQ
jgi:hypothetical protein